MAAQPIDIQQEIAEPFIRNGWKLAVAESCTGGALSAAITAIPGASVYFNGGVVSYSNEVKMNILGVPFQILESVGAVSSECAEAMAVGVRKALDADYALSTTGIAGPGGETPGKPVGTVWIAVAGPNGVRSEKFTFPHDRPGNIEAFVQAALRMLAAEIEKD